MYYIAMVDDGVVQGSVYCENEPALREYFRRFHDEKDPNVYKIDEEKLTRIQTKYPGEELLYQMDGLYLTDSEMEYVSQCAMGEVDEVHHSLKKARKLMKYFQGDAARKLEKAIENFLSERVKNPEFCLDEYDEKDILFEKLRFSKYAKLVLNPKKKK